MKLYLVEVEQIFEGGEIKIKPNGDMFEVFRVNEDEVDAEVVLASEKYGRYEDGDLIQQGYTSIMNGMLNDTEIQLYEMVGVDSTPIDGDLFMLVVTDICMYKEVE